jgi:hypothetical protein
MRPYGEDNKRNTVHDVDKCLVCGERSGPIKRRARRQAVEYIAAELAEAQNQNITSASRH